MASLRSAFIRSTKRSQASITSGRRSLRIRAGKDARARSRAARSRCQYRSSRSSTMCRHIGGGSGSLEHDPATLEHVEGAALSHPGRAAAWQTARRLAWPAALPALVAVSTVVHWFGARRVPGLWIVPDEAVYGLRALAVWQHGPLPLLHGSGAGYGLLYPVLAGIPLSLGSATQGYAALKVLQALVVSLAAVPVYLYGRRVAPRPYALAAAALTLASPLLLYDGLVMTEVLSYPLAALTLLAVARAVETSRRRDQVVALALIAASILTRTQAVVLLPVFALAAALDAAAARNARRLLRFALPYALVIAGAAAVVAVPGLLGGYAVALRGSYPVTAALRLTYDHLALVALVTGAAPVAALVALAVDCGRRRERDPAVRALVAVAVAAVVLVVAQVGVFSARYSPHLLGRDLAPLPPVLFLVFACWAAREQTRRRTVQTVLAAFAVLALLLLAPWDDLVKPDVFADSLGLIVFGSIHAPPAQIVMIFALVALAAFVAARFVPLLAAAPIFAALVASSVVATPKIAAAAQSVRANELGSSPTWIDRTAHGNAVYVYGGEQLWSEPWLQQFWNRRVTRLVSLAPARVPGPADQVIARPTASGRIPAAQPYAVAPDRMTFVGTPVAHLPLVNSDVAGLTLWHLTPPARVATIEDGVQPNGDMTRPATISVYDCRRGALELTLLPKATRTLTVLLDGRVVLRRSIAGHSSWSGSIPVPPSARPRLCTFQLVPQALLGSTRISFVPGA